MAVEKTSELNDNYYSIEGKERRRSFLSYIGKALAKPKSVKIIGALTAAAVIGLAIGSIFFPPLIIGAAVVAGAALGTGIGVAGFKAYEAVENKVEKTKVKVKEHANKRERIQQNNREITKDNLNTVVEKVNDLDVTKKGTVKLLKKEIKQLEAEIKQSMPSSSSTYGKLGQEALAILNATKEIVNNTTDSPELQNERKQQVNKLLSNFNTNYDNTAGIVHENEHHEAMTNSNENSKDSELGELMNQLQEVKKELTQLKQENAALKQDNKAIQNAVPTAPPLSTTPTSSANLNAFATPNVSPSSKPSPSPRSENSVPYSNNKKRRRR